MTMDDVLSELPPSAKLVVKVLEYNGGMTQKEIVEKSRLSQRTVRDALDRLQENDLVEKDIYIPDARQNLYRLAAPESDDGETEQKAAEAEALLD
ncbi:helix-turn-helix domain-containing protein [Salarchaeum sp. III]|uniref:helix-turn-helix transcriptional regulator n=1 Tax=Salarchaeum sp. III TaxID=3107927 RepID=UPI002ED930F1